MTSLRHGVLCSPYLLVILAFFIDFGHGQSTIPPQLNVATSDVRVRAGDSAVLTCVVDYLGAHQLTWHRGQNVVLAVDEKLIINDRRMSVGRPSIRTWELRIQNVSRRDAGEYVCVINSRDLPSGKIALVVEEPPKIVNPPPSVVTMDEFETFKLICNATGFPRPRVEWFRVNDREEISSFSRSKSRISATFVLLSTEISENYGEILLFINVTRDCFGRYRCRASNGVGEAEQRDIEVNVIARPVVVVDPENVGRERGGKVTVDCSISGHPISWAGWFLRGELLTNGGQLPSPPPLRRSALSVPNLGSPGSMKQAASTRHRVEWLGRSSAYRAVLRLTIDPIVSDADFGSYTCAATDGRSFTSNASFYLWEKTPMPPPDVGEAGVIDGILSDIATTPSWRPSIILDSRPKPTEDDYVVAATNLPPEDRATVTSTFEQQQPPKIADEAWPSQPSDMVYQPPTPNYPSAVPEIRPAANQKRGSASTTLRKDFGHQFLVTGGLLIAAVVFHLWLTSPVMPENSKSSPPSATIEGTSQQQQSPLSICSTQSSISNNLQSLVLRRRRRRLFDQDEENQLQVTFCNVEMPRLVRC